MAVIETRQTSNGGVSYRVKVRLKGFPAQSASFERVTDAKRWAQQTESEIRQGRYFKTSESRKHTLAQAIDRYIDAVLSNKPKSFYDQKTQLLWWKENLGSRFISDVTAVVISEMRDKLAKGTTIRGTQRSTGTVNRYLAVLSHLFTIAVKEWGWSEENPLSKVSKLKEPRGRVRFLAEPEREKLLAACKESANKYLYLIVILCLSTGARKMEIVNLSWNDVDLNRGVVTLHETKNGERRILPITGRALQLFKEYAKNKKADTDLVFPGNKPNQSIDIRSSWETAIKKAGIEDFRFHDLRHSAASYLAMSGATMAEIAEVLGHKTLQMVKRYAHLSEAHTASIVSKMNERIFG